MTFIPGIDIKISKAVSGMQLSMNLSPQGPEIDFKMLELLDKKIELEQAISQFNKTISLQPGFNGLDLNKIGMISKLRKPYEDKLSLFHNVIEHRPDNDEAHYHILPAFIQDRDNSMNPPNG